MNRFFQTDPAAKASVLRWYLLAKEANWPDFTELRRTFPATDLVGNDLYVFNIGGNKYRLIARIIFSTRTMFIRFIGTHKEYNLVNLTDL